ncbi:MAG: hypothetical protein ACTSU9_16470, partial [Promethearchaeota archaeon]
MKAIRHGSRNLKKKVLTPLLILILPIASLPYIFTCVKSINEFASYLNETPVDYSGLIPPNYTRLSEMAVEFQYYMERDNLPLNYTLTAYWNSGFSAISMWGTAGDAAIWTGMTLGMASLRYAVMRRDGNTTEVAESLSFVKKMVSGVSLLLAVPNGGIGPGYPGILARSVSPKNWTGSNSPILGYDYANGANGINTFDGAGAYNDWLWIGYPSLDQYSGIIMGITMAAALVKDDAWVQEQSRLLASQLVEYFRKTNWRLVDAGGRTTGQLFDYNLEHPAHWLLGLLFMGATADPGRYLDLYYNYAFQRGYADKVLLWNDLRMFSLFNYFNTNINWVMFYAMATFESHPYIKHLYQETMAKHFYPAVKNHRNAWFNMVYLHVMERNESDVQLDVLDQLMRFDLERISGDANSTRLPERGLSATNFYPLVNSSWPRVNFSDWLDTKWQFPAAGWNIA